MARLASDIAAVETQSALCERVDMTRRNPKPNLVLIQFLPYLLNRAGVKIGQRFSDSLKDFGLTMPEWRILIALWQAENQPLNAIADINVCDLSTMSRQARALEKAGFIVRRRSKKDGRALKISLTPKGRKATSEIIPIAKLLERTATQGVDEKDLTIVRRCMSRIYRNLEGV